MPGRKERVFRIALKNIEKKNKERKKKACQSSGK